MPLHIQDHTLYHDRTVQDWHRVALPPMATAIDLDLMGACKACSMPTYLIEATTSPNKPTAILRQLAQRADLPALLIVHDCSVVLYADSIWPRTNHRVSGDAEVAAWLLAFIQRHYTDVHPHYRPRQLFDQMAANQQEGERNE